MSRKKIVTIYRDPLRVCRPHLGGCRKSGQLHRKLQCTSSTHRVFDVPTQASLNSPASLIASAAIYCPLTHTFIHTHMHTRLVNCTCMHTRVHTKYITNVICRHMHTRKRTHINIHVHTRTQLQHAAHMRKSAQTHTPILIQIKHTRAHPAYVLTETGPPHAFQMYSLYFS